MCCCAACMQTSNPAIPLAQPFKCHRFRHTMEILSYTAQTFVSPTLSPCFWIPAVNTQLDSLMVECDGLHDIPTAQSAYVFSVGSGSWKMSEQKGLTDSSDSAANWQHYHSHCQSLSQCLSGVDSEVRASSRPQMTSLTLDSFSPGSEVT